MDEVKVKQEVTTENEPMGTCSRCGAVKPLKGKDNMSNFTVKTGAGWACASGLICLGCGSAPAPYSRTGFGNV